MGEPGAVVDHGVEEDVPRSLPAFRGSVPVAAAAVSAPPTTGGIRPSFFRGWTGLAKCWRSVSRVSRLPGSARTLIPARMECPGVLRELSTPVVVPVTLGSPRGARRISPHRWWVREFGSVGGAEIAVAGVVVAQPVAR